MRGWRGVWLRAQLTGIVVSSCVWIVLVAAAPVIAALLVVAMATITAGWNTQAGLWWRYGVRPVPELVADQVWDAVVPVRSLRGRGQPRLWWARWGVEVVAASTGQLVLSDSLVDQIARRRIAGDKLAALLLHAIGCEPVTSSRMVAAVNCFCWPWVLVTSLTRPFGRRARRLPLIGAAWKLRWIIFGIAIVQSWLEGRWPALIGVAIIAVLSAVGPRLAAAWEDRAQQLGDDKVIAEGYGPVLAGLIVGPQSRLPDLERARRLTGTGP